MFLFNNKTTNKKSEQTAAAQESYVVKSWYMEQYESIIIQRNILLFGILISFVMLAVGIWFIKNIQESHTVEPFVIQIESKTGVPTVVNPLDAREFTAKESIKRYFIMQYIRAREEYTAASHAKSKEVVNAMSSINVRREYFKQVSSANQESPSQKYGDKTTLEVKLKSLLFLTPNVAQIRASIISQGDIRKSEEKLIRMEFDFINLNLNRTQREQNPLGFIVNDYKITNEEMSA